MVVFINKKRVIFYILLSHEYLFFDPDQSHIFQLQEFVKFEMAIELPLVPFRMFTKIRDVFIADVVDTGD